MEIRWRERVRRFPGARWLLVAGPALLLAACGGAWVLGWMGKGEVAPAGGLWFPVERAVAVPLFSQADARWGGDRLGTTAGTLAAEGCAVASAAMVMAHYGFDTDPGRLNKWLTDHGGYTERGWLYWEKASEAASAGGVPVRHVYEDAASHFLMDVNAWRGNPTIVRLRYPNGITHFVVVVGKRGFDYLVRDPGAGGGRGIYPLREFGSRVEALRFYRRGG